VKEPRRLLADQTTPELTRSLLIAGRKRRAPGGARERVWGALAVGLAAGSATGSVTGAAAAGARAGAAGAGAAATGTAGAKAGGTALALTKAKLLVVGAMLATGAGVTIAASSKDEPPSASALASAGTAPAEKGTRHELRALPPPPSARVTQASPEPPAIQDASAKAGPSTRVEGNAEAISKRTARTRADTAASPGAHEVTTTSRPAAVPPVVEHVPVAIDASQLREEAALLHEVRAALARGDVAGAGSKLEDAQRRFPKSQLAQERDALEVRLAIESGDRARAAALARAFVERHPDSPLRPGIEAAVRAPEEP